MPVVALIARANSYRLPVYVEAAQQNKIPIAIISDGGIGIAPPGALAIKADLSDEARETQHIARQLGALKIAAVIGCDDSVVELAARVAASLGIRCNTAEAMRTARRKDLAREALSRFGLPAPNFTVARLDQDIPSQLQSVRYPCVAKPINLSASRGVIRADNLTGLRSAVERIRAILLRETRRSEDQIVLVEDYIPGSEHALEGFIEQGRLETICLFDKPDPLVGPYFEETYYVTPSRLPDDVQREIGNVIQTACVKFGLMNGPLHAEVRVNAQGIWILEVAARTIGGDCGRLFELATNRGLEDYVLARASGCAVERIRFSESAGVLMIPVESSGIVRRVEGLSEALAVDNILDIRVDVRTGERLVKWPEGDKYPGFIFAKAKTPAEVEDALRQSYAKLNIVTMPELPTMISPKA